MSFFGLWRNCEINYIILVLVFARLMLKLVSDGGQSISKPLKIKQIVDFGAWPVFKFLVMACCYADMLIDIKCCCADMLSTI